MPPKVDDKKKEEKPAAPVADKNPATEIGMMLLVLMLGGALVSRLVAFLSGDFTTLEIWQKVSDAYDSYKFFAGIFIVGISAFILRLVSKMNAIRSEERAELFPEKEESAEQIVNAKWQRVIDHLESENSSDWKLAVLEADIILNEMLNKMGYQGATIGEKLKSIERSDFTTIDMAWEAHKTRNLIAHEGSDFVLTQREAIRVIELYRSVFQEFFFI